MAVCSAPTHKRKRSSSLDDVVSPPAKRAIRRHEALWHDDGNIAVLAEDEYFCLHRGVLALHSDVFRDMFSLPPARVVETVDGCPVVRLADGAADLALLFSAIYGAGRRTWYNPEVSVPFADLRTVLNLSMKYGVQHLADEALHRLRQCFPTSLSGWDSNLHVEDKHPPIQITKHDAIAVMNLARRFDFPDLLPSALYTICQLPKGDILKAVQYGPDDYEQLCPMDVQLCLAGADALLDMHRYAEDVLVLPKLSNDCRFPDMCESLLLQLPGRFMARRLMRGYDPLRDYLSSIDVLVEEVPGLLCNSCDASLKERLHACRRKVWDELPVIFGLV